MGWKGLGPAARAVCVAVGGCLMAALMGCSLDPQGAGGSAAGPQSVEPSRAFGARGELRTAPFALRGGRYAVRWEAESPAAGEACPYRVTLETARAQGGAVELVTNEVSPGPAIRGESSPVEVPAGEYVLHVQTSCNWSATLRPR